MKLYISYNLNELIKAIHRDSRWKGKEWSWLVKVERVWTDYRMTDIFFPKQKNQAAHTEFSWDPVNELIEYLWDKIEDIGKYAIRLHSHQSMSAFWSWEDHRTRKWFKDWWCDEFVSVVTSQTSWSNKIDWIYYHATLDIFNPVDMAVDLKMELWLPWVTELEEVQSEDYIKYLEEEQERIEEFKASEVQRKQQIENNNLIVLNNATILKDKYWLSDELLQEYIEKNVFEEKEYKPRVFKWSESTVFYNENNFDLDIEAKIKELDAAEEKVKTYSYLWWWSKKSLWDDAPTVDENWNVKWIRTTDWSLVLDELWYPWFRDRVWRESSIRDLETFYEDLRGKEKSYSDLWDKWIRNFKNPYSDWPSKKNEAWVYTNSLFWWQWAKPFGDDDYPRYY